MKENLLLFTLICLVCLGCLHTPPELPVAFSTSETEQEAKALQEKIACSPTDVEAHVALAKLFLSEGYPDRALSELEAGMQSDQRHVEVRLLLCSVLQKTPNPDWKRIENLLRETVELDPQRGDMQLYLGNVLTQCDKDADALECFILAEERSQDPAILVAAYLEQAAILQKQGHKDAAAECMSKAMAIYPGVDDLVRDAEIQKLCPQPQYGGVPGYETELSTHPQLERRIQLLREQIEKGKGNQP